MLLIIKKKIWLFVFLVSNFSLSLCEEEPNTEAILDSWYKCPSSDFKVGNNLDVTVEIGKFVVENLTMQRPDSDCRTLDPRIADILESIENLPPFPPKEPKQVSWIGSFVVLLNNPETKKYLSELVSIIYDDVSTDPELKRLKKEGEELRMTNKKLQKDLQGQEDMLQQSPQFFEEISKLQLRLEAEAAK